MKVSVLGSGSKGNCIYIEHDGHAILVDAGFSPAEVDRRLAKIGVIGHGHIEGLYLTHDHGDHARYSNQIRSRWHLRSFLELPLKINVARFAVPHDAEAACGYIIEVLGRSLAIALDLGCITLEVSEALAGRDVIILGCDYDDDLLDANTDYPAETKNRIRSNTGHLSNAAVAAWLREDWDGKAHTIILAHLSEANNKPALALQSAVNALERRGYKYAETLDRAVCLCSPERLSLFIVVSGQDDPTSLVEV